MTPRKRTVTGESEPQAAWAAITELKTSVDGQLETTGDLRERVKALETIGDLRERVKALETTGDLRERMKALETALDHYATKDNLANVKVWTVTGVAGALLSIVIALVVALVRSSIGN